MTQYDLHSQKVNLTMVSAHYALRLLYKQFGGDLLRNTINSFEERDRAEQSTPVVRSLAYSKGGELILR